MGGGAFEGPARAPAPEASAANASARTARARAVAFALLAGPLALLGAGAAAAVGFWGGWRPGRTPGSWALPLGLAERGEGWALAVFVAMVLLEPLPSTLLVSLFLWVSLHEASPDALRTATRAWSRRALFCTLLGVAYLGVGLSRIGPDLPDLGLVALFWAAWVAYGIAMGAACRLQRRRVDLGLSSASPALVWAAGACGAAGLFLPGALSLWVLRDAPVEGLPGPGAPLPLLERAGVLGYCVALLSTLVSALARLHGGASPGWAALLVTPPRLLVRDLPLPVRSGTLVWLNACWYVLLAFLVSFLAARQRSGRS